MEGMPEGVKVSSLYKALRLLDYFNNENPERGVSELAELSGMLKSSAHNIMSTFEVCGFVEKNPKTSRYRLGIKILELNNVVSHSDVFGEIIRPHMNVLADSIRETVFFATPDGVNMVYREAAFPAHSLSTRAIRGVIAPMYCTGLGKAYLAYQESYMVEWVIASGLPPFTANTITDPDGFRREMERIRGQGYAVDNMEHEYGIKCVAVPVYNGNSEIIGGMSITGPSLRFPDDVISRYVPLMQETMKQIKNRL